MDGGFHVTREASRYTAFSARADRSRGPLATRDARAANVERTSRTVERQVSDMARLLGALLNAIAAAASL